MPALPAAVGPCVEEAVARASQVMARVVDHACTRLQQQSRAAAGPLRQDLALAAAEVARHRVPWCAGIAGALRREMQAQESAPAAVRIHPSSLTLVDDGEVTQNIESSRLAMELETRLEKPLAEFDRYMSGALRLQSIQPEENPLRPAVFARAVRSVMSESDPQPGRPALWMQPMAEPLAAELAALYETGTKLLARAQVQPAAYRISTPAPLAPRNGRAISAGVPLRAQQERRSRSTVSGWAQLATQAIGGPALRDFLFGVSPQAQQALAPSYYRQIDEELAALEARRDEAPAETPPARKYRNLAPVDRPMRAVGTDTPLDREVWGDYGAARQRSLVRTRLRRQAKQVDQALGLDLVRQLVDQVAQDPRLLAPVREAVVALEPSLARLALHSPRFVAQQGNAARRLLESVAQRSFSYNDEFSTEFRDFFDGVSRVFNALNRDDGLGDAGPFEQALGELEQGWSAQDREEERQREQILRAVHFAEERQGEADRIAWELGQRSDLEGTPAVVQDFLFETWSLVIAHARLSNAGTADVDPGGYIGVIAELLWSVNRQTLLRDPARAFEVIPHVLPTLRSGLQLLGHPPLQTESFFQALERLHRPVLKLRAKLRQSSLDAQLAAAPLDDDLKPAPAHKPQAHDELWMQGSELRACGFEDTLPSDYAALQTPRQLEDEAADTSLAPATSVSAAAVPAAQAHALIEGLQEGCWVDLFSKQRWRRARLTWASSGRTLFMFVSLGGRPHSMTRRSLQRLVSTRLLRPVDSREVVQHALDTVMRPPVQPLQPGVCTVAPGAAPNGPLHAPRAARAG